MNRRERRAQERKLRRQKVDEETVNIESPTTNHATVMVMNQPDWTPFQRTAERERDGAQLWENSRYIVAVYPPERYAEGWPRFVHLSFKHHANVAISDFRDMQAIKNALIGEESMAVQIFPAESQLIDGANQYHLWCLVPYCWPEVDEDTDWPWLPVGFMEGRMVTDVAPEGGRQRTFEDHQGLREDDPANAAEMLAKAMAQREE